MPELLKMLDIRGAVVTVDALNTQTQTAGEIVKGGGDYVMAVKDNHPTLCDTVQRNLDEMILEKFAGMEHVYHETTERGHGRIDTRKVWATSRRYYISSLPSQSGERFAKQIREKRPALDAGHGFQRRPEPGAEGPWGSESCCSAADCPGTASTRQKCETGRQEQAAQGGPEPGIPPAHASIDPGGQMTWPWSLLSGLDSSHGNSWGQAS